MSEHHDVQVEAIHGNDDRLPVAQPQLPPWPAICALRITAANGDLLDGTGFLIGPSAVLTTGHNIFDHARGGQAQKIRVIPALRGGVTPFGDFFSSTFRIATGWQQTKAPERDYGAVLLANTIGTQTGTV